MTDDVQGSQAVLVADGDGNRARELINELASELEAEGDLESTDPEKAFEMWLGNLGDKADSTIQSYRYRVGPFLEFLNRKGIDDLADLSTRDVKEFEAERNEAGLQRQTRNNQFGTIRQYLAYCYDLNAIPKSVAVALDVPDLAKEDRVNTEKLTADRAENILDNLERFRYASKEHVVFLLLWRTTMRVGAVHSLDLSDCFLDEDEDEGRLWARLESEDLSSAAIEDVVERASFPFVWPQHRPPKTPLKNGEDSERVINISESTAQVLQDYIRVNRFEMAEDDGRRPLITSSKGGGRLSPSRMRVTCYTLTQPCEFGAPCPHDRAKETCEAREDGYGARCPSSRSPHKIRTGAITHHRDRGWPKDVLSDKADTSEQLIEDVYDQPDKVLRGSQRRSYLNLLEEDDS